MRVGIHDDVIIALLDHSRQHCMDLLESLCPANSPRDPSSSLSLRTPKTECTILVPAHPDASAWSLARHTAPSAMNKEANNICSMPDCCFWSWLETHIENLDDVEEKIKTIESILTWERRVVKNGTDCLNPQSG
ncbi:hypothetical protein Vi05172_g11759 [Venturia inaequalis]|nr:hypothetical protein Vi05172_g11759 [Venturia inaequalis]